MAQRQQNIYGFTLIQASFKYSLGPIYFVDCKSLSYSNIQVYSRGQALLIFLLASSNLMLILLLCTIPKKYLGRLFSTHHKNLKKQETNFFLKEEPTKHYYWLAYSRICSNSPTLKDKKIFFTSEKFLIIFVYSSFF